MSYASLPTAAHEFIEGTFNWGLVDSTQNDQSDILDGSFRATTTKSIYVGSWVYRARTTAEMLAFETFISDTVKGRLEPFYFTHPFSDVTHLVRFESIPSAQRVGASLYDFAIQVKVI